MPPRRRLLPKLAGGSITINRLQGNFLNSRFVFSQAFVAYF